MTLSPLIRMAEQPSTPAGINPEPYQVMFRRSMKSQTAWEVCRKIKLPALSHAADAMAVERALIGIPGVIKTEISLDRRRLLALYNTTLTDFSTITQILEDTGFPPAQGWWHRVKGHWYEYLDDTARSNAKSPAAPCCNKPPK